MTSASSAVRDAGSTLCYKKNSKINEYDNLELIVSKNEVEDV